MKKYLKDTFINLVSLYLLDAVLEEGIIFSSGQKTIIIASLALTLLNKLVKPIIKLFLLPLNLLTLGMFRWAVNIIILLLLAWLVPGFQIKHFHFSGFSYQGFSFPELELGFFWTLTVASFLLSIFTSFFYWLVK